MSNTANIALTALHAFERKSEVIADNIANINTDRFRKSRAETEEVSPSGVRVTIGQADTPEDTVAIGEAEGEPSNVTMEEELIALMVNRHNYAANIKTVDAYDEMQGTLLDILG